MTEFDRNDICWQYLNKKENYQEDIKNSKYKKQELENISVNDISYSVADKDDERELEEIKNFIKRHEWLGELPLYRDYIFRADYKDELVGVEVIGTPYAYANLLGEEYKELERMIHRGAVISYAPKNLPSSLLMWCIRWMVKNTKYRVFTCYADPEAGELGTIYQACNFYYLGQDYGAKKEYYDPERGNPKWSSSRQFRTRSAYKRYAKKLGIEWGDDWHRGDKVYWENIPDDIEEKLREESRRRQKQAKTRDKPDKHKYCYILGKDKRETRKLRDLFEEKNPEYDDKDYPSEEIRGEG